MAESRVPAWASPPERSGNLYLQPVPPLGSAPQRSWCVDRKAGYLLGRNTDAVDVPVDHKSASRVHACLAHGPAPGELHLLDLGSVHGGLFLSQPLPFTNLCDGTCRGGGLEGPLPAGGPQKMNMW